MGAVKTVTYAQENGVATITMNRPDMLNALNAEMGADLTQALGRAQQDEARVVLVAGAGRAFCAGGDLKAMAEGLSSAGGTEQSLGAILRNFHEVVKALYNTPVPVIGALHGAVVGAGMSIALVCDVRIAAEDAYFQQAFIRLGLTPDGGSSWLLPRAVGAARAAQLTMSGETIDARRAAEWGLVNEVVPAGQHLDRARDLATRIAAFAPNAMRGLKALLRASAGATFDAQLAAEADAQVANAARPEFAAALRAFLARKS